MLKNDTHNPTARIAAEAVGWGIIRPGCRPLKSHEVTDVFNAFRQTRGRGFGGMARRSVTVLANVVAHRRAGADLLMVVHFGAPGELLLDEAKLAAQVPPWLEEMVLA